MSLQEVLVPDIGGYKNVSVIEMMVKVGDSVSVDTPLLTLETDKATMDIPSPMAGIIQEMHVKVGSKVSQSSLIMRIAVEGGQVELDNTPSAIKKESKIQADTAPKASPSVSNSAISALPIGHETQYASPIVRRLARELGLDLTQLFGTGRKGRITQEDVKSAIQNLIQEGGAPSHFKVADDPEVDFNEFGPTKSVELLRIKKLSSAALHRNWVKIPHVTFFEKSDITGLEAFRGEHKASMEKRGLKLTPLAFIVKACARVLLDFPNVNASLSADGQNLVLKQYVHIGVAVDTPQGLMVPVIRNADQKGLLQIAQEITELSQKCKEGTIKGKDMQGGCFTISSVGHLGTLGFTPIINMPELAILGVSKAVMEPFFDGKSGFVPRLMLPLSLSVDHRVIDGVEGAKFLVAITALLSDIRQLIM